MKNAKSDIQKLLQQGITIQLTPKGYSMYPMLIPGRDSVVLKRAERDKLSRGDVVLYRRREGYLVLHRIWRVCQDGIYLVGDNQIAVEGPIAREHMIGILTAFIRDGRRISVTNPIYCLYSRIWLMLRPYRWIIGGKLRRICNLYNKINTRHRKGVTPNQ